MHTIKTTINGKRNVRPSTAEERAMILVRKIEQITETLNAIREHAEDNHFGTDADHVNYADIATANETHNRLRDICEFLDIKANG